MITAELRLRQEGPLRDPSKRFSEGALARSGRAHAVADALCFASAGANRLVLIEGGAAKVFNKPCSSSAAAHGRTMVNELGAQQPQGRCSHQVTQLLLQEGHRWSHTSVLGFDTLDDL
jgi:hypothetical protein